MLSDVTIFDYSLDNKFSIYYYTVNIFLKSNDKEEVTVTDPNRKLPVR